MTASNAERIGALSIQQGGARRRVEELLVKLKDAYGGFNLAMLGVAQGQRGDGSPHELVGAPTSSNSLGRRLGPVKDVRYPQPEELHAILVELEQKRLEANDLQEQIDRLCADALLDVDGA